MSPRRILLWCVCLSGLPLAACSVSVDGGATAAEAIVEAPDMDDYWAAHVAHRQSGDVEAALAILAEDCVLYEPFSPPVRGLENIAPKFEAGFSMVETHDLSFDSLEVYHQGESLVDLGTFSETFSLPGSEERHTVAGSYFAVLTPNAAGEWKIRHFMPMPATPPPGAPTEGDSASADQADR